MNFCVALHMHNAWLDRHAFQFDPADERTCFAYCAIVIGVVVIVGRQLSHAVPAELRFGACGFDTCKCRRG
jgi:hypothetical protein